MYVFRWDKVVSRSSDRTRQLDQGHKKAKAFQDQWQELINWLNENTAELENQKSLASDPEKIKEQIYKHKAFQRTLGAKQPTFDSVGRMGRHLKDNCPKIDLPVLHGMLGEMKSKWNNLCARSVDR